MRSLTHLFVTTALAVSATIISGCSTTQPPAAHDASSPSKNPPAPHFSSFVQHALTRLEITPQQREDLDALEQVPSLSTNTQPEIGFLILSEVYLDRGTSIFTTDPAAARDAWIRSAHFAYEGLLSEGCATLDPEPCRLLASAYGRAVSLIVRETNFGNAPLQHDAAARYLVDFEGDNDPLTPSEWSFLAPTESFSSRTGIGAPVVACAKPSPTDPTSRPMTCVPATFLLHFDAPTRDGGTRAHLVAHDAFDRSVITLHGREFPLAANFRSVWEVLLSSDAPLACLGELLPNASAAILLVDNAPARSDWSEIGEALALDTGVSAVYNLCAYHSKNSPELSTVLAQSLRTSGKPASVVLVSQGADNDHTASALAALSKQESLTAKKNGGSVLLTVAGTLSVPARQRRAATHDPTTSRRSPTSVIAERDIKRLLTRLIEEELVPLPPRERGSTDSPPDLSLSPVM